MVGLFLHIGAVSASQPTTGEGPSVYPISRIARTLAVAVVHAASWHIWTRLPVPPTLWPPACYLQSRASYHRPTMRRKPVTGWDSGPALARLISDWEQELKTLNRQFENLGTALAATAKNYYR